MMFEKDKKKTWTKTSSTLSEVSAKTYAPYTSKSPRLGVSVMHLLLVLLKFCRFQKARIKLTLQFLYVVKYRFLSHRHYGVIGFDIS